MTAVVGLVHDGRVYIGGDAQATSGWKRMTLAQPKVARVGPYVYGFCGSLRSGQLLGHALDWPAPTIDLDRFMATTFVNAVRTALKDGGHASKTSEQEHNTDSQFLVGVAGRLFAVHSDYGITEAADGIAAVGCGADFALGALHATDGQSPKRRLRTALEAAARFSIGVSGPFTIVSGR